MMPRTLSALHWSKAAFARDQAPLHGQPDAAPSVAQRAPATHASAEHWVNNPKRHFTMTPAKPFTLLLALCLGCASPLASAATDLNHQRAPGMQSNESGQMNDQGGATGSGAPADGMGTGDGGTDDNGTNNTGGDGTDSDSGTGSHGAGSNGTDAGVGGSGSNGSGSRAGSGT